MKGASRLVFGTHPVLEALRARAGDVVRVWVTAGGSREELARLCEQRGVPLEEASKEALDARAKGGRHQGVLAELSEYRYAPLEALLERAEAAGSPPLLLALDGIQDPRNLGAILRSAHALGAHGVLVPQDRAASVTATVGRASAGAIEHIPVTRVVNLARTLDELKERANVWVAAADPDGDQPPEKAPLTGPLVLVVGAEGKGVRPNVLKRCDFKVRIPMPGKLGSLNASVSAAILLYEVLRQRAERSA